VIFGGEGPALQSFLAEPVFGDGDFLGLRLDAPLPAGSAEIRIRYTGRVRQGETSGIFRAQDQNNDYILTQFESTNARDAFPCFDEPSYKVPWQLTLHIPKDDKAVSNTPVGSQKTDGGTTTYIFKETKPLPSYLIAFGVGPFEFVDAGQAGANHAPVRIVTPKGRAGEAKYAAEVTASILTRLEEYFGIPFPYEKSDQVAVPVTGGFGAMENAGMVTYGQNLILAKPETDTIDRQRTYALVAAHELSHQWFGDLVTTEWWNDIWLNEAFATWMQQKLLAEWKPEWKTRVEDVDAKLHAQDEDSLVTARKIRQGIETKDDIANAFDGITYLKGAALIGMFEAWIGPETFRKGVQRYLVQHAFRNATTGDFLDSLSSAAKKNVTGAFSTFLNQPGVPMLTVALDCKHAPTLHIEQQRLLPLGSKGSPGQVWSIPVCVRYGTAKDIQSECALMTGASMDWPLSKANSCPTWVQANDDARGYYHMDYQGGLFAALNQPDGARHLTAAERVDLIGNAAAVAKTGKLSAADTLGLVELFHDYPERKVVERALDAAIAPRADLVPLELMDNYERFLRNNFGRRAHALGWLPRAGDSDDVRLLRPTLVGDVATYGGDQELATQAQQLVEEWLHDHTAVNPDIVGAVLKTAAFYGDRALFERLLVAFKGTSNRQEQQLLLKAMTAFREPAAIQAGMNAVLTREVALVDGSALLLSAGQNERQTRELAFEFVRAHFDELMSGHPSIFGFDFGSFLPRVGESFCDANSRNDLHGFFGPRAEKYTGAPRALAQVLEGIDLCIANKRSQQESVIAFLKSR
jgi:alanyl aminopeptidase